MTNAERLIENVIRAMSMGTDPEVELSSPDNMRMLAYTGLRKFDLIAIASHIVYELYDGKFPARLNLEETEHEQRRATN